MNTSVSNKVELTVSLASSGRRGEGVSLGRWRLSNQSSVTVSQGFVLSPAAMGILMIWFGSSNKCFRKINVVEICLQKEAEGKSITQIIATFVDVLGSEWASEII